MKIAIIGAGLSGIISAHRLKNIVDVTVFDKSRGVGGRMCTRRAEPYRFDHGAQYFTAHSPEFQEWLTPMVAEGIVKPWHARFVEIEDRKITRSEQWNDSPPHYVAVPQMNSLHKWLCENLQVQLNTKVHSVEKVERRWQLKSDKGLFLGEYDWVIVSTPAEQASELIPPTISFHSTLQTIKTLGCFSLMLGFEKPLDLQFDAALIHGEDIGWIAVNNSKPERSQAFSLVIQSTNPWAEAHLEGDQSEIVHELMTSASELLNQDLSKANHQTLHRWRYANAPKSQTHSHLIDTHQQLAVCGDWLIEGRVEAAFKSGFDLAHTLSKII